MISKPWITNERDYEYGMMMGDMIAVAFMIFREHHSRQPNIEEYDEIMKLIEEHTVGIKDRIYKSA